MVESYNLVLFLFFFSYETVFERILILFWEIFLFLEFFFFLLQEKLRQLDCCQGDYNPRKKER